MLRRSGGVLSDYHLVKELISKTKTDTDLKVVARLNLKHYPTGRKTTREQVDYDRIHFNKQVAHLSYRIAA
jgi:hypothetical protein